MKRKNMTRNALVTSILALLVCVSMLVGATFAWFTDEVTTGMNTIAAGNLDIELKADGQNVTASTKLFDDVELWEPGVVVYENLQVANVGTLALKYQMTLNFGNENDLNGHKLSEVLKIAAIDKLSGTETRAEVLAKAKAAAGQGMGTLSNFYLTGELAPGESSAEKTFVIFWEPSDNATDNLYNANNGQKTSDEKPLHIEFGINLQATQLMHEDDSFGNDYDEFASILPKAKVKNLGAQTVSATLNGWGSSYQAEEYELPFTLKFEPNEKWWEDNEETIPGTAQSSAYKYWHADYVVKADKDVPANSIALLGYYKAFCDTANNGNWVALSADQKISAGTEIRLVDVMGGGESDGTGTIKVTYKDICQWGNDGTGFLCSATDLTGANAGTTLTVELRMYANESDPADSSYNGGTETGEYYVIGTYTYTFGAVEVDTADELQAAINNGIPEIKLIDDIDLGTTNITVPKGITTTLDLNGFVISGVCNANDATAFTVENDATLNIKDSGTSGKITLAAGSSKQGYTIKAKGTLNLYSGTIELAGDWSGGINYAVDVAPNVWGGTAENAVFNMYGGKLISAKDAIRIANYSAESNAYMKVGFNMEGGEIIAARDGIFMQQHNEKQFDLFVTMTGGTIKAAVRPIRVYGPMATGTLSGNAKSMTITAKSDALVLTGALDTTMTWHTEGKIAVGGGMDVGNLNTYANITLN